MTSAPTVAVREVRVLEGPNLYFPRPAIKASLALPGYLAADESALRELAARIGLRGSRPGSPHTEQRQRFVLRVVERAVRRVATSSGTTRLGVRTRPGSELDDVVVAFVWRRRDRVRALGRAVGPVLEAGLEGGDAVEEQVLMVGRTEPGDRPSTITPSIPVASVTGTNG